MVAEQEAGPEKAGLWKEGIGKASTLAGKTCAARELQRHERPADRQTAHTHHT